CNGPADFYSAGSYAAGIYNDIATDPAFGARYVATLVHWWKHVTEYFANKYGSGRPMIVFGLSMGGFTALQILANDPHSIVGCIAHCPMTIAENISPAFSAPIAFNNLNCSG